MRANERRMETVGREASAKYVMTRRRTGKFKSRTIPTPAAFMTTWSHKKHRMVKSMLLLRRQESMSLSSFTCLW